MDLCLELTASGLRVQRGRAVVSIQRNGFTGQQLDNRPDDPIGVGGASGNINGTYSGMLKNTNGISRIAGNAGYAAKACTRPHANDVRGMLRHFSHNFGKSDFPVFVCIGNAAMAIEARGYSPFDHEDIVALLDRMLEHRAAAFAGKTHERLMVRKIDGIGKDRYDGVRSGNSVKERNRATGTGAAMQPDDFRRIGIGQGLIESGQIAGC